MGVECLNPGEGKAQKVKNKMITTRITNISHAFLWIFCCLFSMTGCSLEKGTAGESYTREVFAMDTYMTLTLYEGEAVSDATAALDAAVNEIERLDRLLSTGKDDSEVVALNRNGGGILSEDTRELWESSLEIYKETEGAFDVTIYPVMRAWGFAGGEFRVPEEGELQELTVRVNSSLVQWEASSGKLTLPGQTELDFGGIAKGYTGRKLAEILSSHGVKSALLDLGGNIQLVGCKPDGSKFKIAIRDPENSADAVGVLALEDTAVVTSGGYERYFEEGGLTYHHIIDPSTGCPADRGLSSVTVVCRDGTLADGYSTALFIMGTEKAISFWKEHEQMFDAVFVTEEGQIIVTSGLEKCFTSDRSYRIVRAE